MKQETIKALVTKLTLEEKAGLCSGQDNWFTKAIARLSIPACRTSDGPHGLRTQAGESNNLAQDARRNCRMNNRIKPGKVWINTRSVK